MKLAGGRNLALSANHKKETDTELSISEIKFIGKIRLYMFSNIISNRERKRKSYICK